MTEATSRAAAKMPLTTPSLSAGIRWEVILSIADLSPGRPHCHPVGFQRPYGAGGVILAGGHRRRVRRPASQELERRQCDRE
jgi:hypothetical protein